jgi:hypothetical protein
MLLSVAYHILHAPTCSLPPENCTDPTPHTYSYPSQHHHLRIQ